MKNISQKGFTLVELSIVLVIIGLLIGGILVGQSLIESAKMQSFVRQIEQFDAATALFKSKYRALPGDAKAFGCTDSGTTNTCGNGFVEANFATVVVLFNLETSFFWKNLSDSGFKPNGESYSNFLQNSTVQTGFNVPAAEIGDGAGVAARGAVDGDNLYYIGGYTGNSGFGTAAGISVVDALAYDAKVDDGVANDGDVVAGLISFTPNTLCSDGADYTIASGDDIVCGITIKMLSGMDF